MKEIIVRNMFEKYRNYEVGNISIDICLCFINLSFSSNDKTS